MSEAKEKINYLIEKFDSFDCSGEEFALFLSSSVWEKAYKILSENPNITYEEYYMLMDMHYIKFIHDFQFEESAILVRFYDEDNEGENHEIYQWLREHGFGCEKGYWGCNWVFIDLINKKFYPGRPGVEYFKPASGHSINDDEFYTIMHMLNFYEEMTELEYKTINFIFNRKYKSTFEPVSPSNYEMQQFIIPKLEKINAWRLVESWSCHNTNIKKCYKLLLENPDITLAEYKEKSGWNNKRNGSAGIYSFKIDD